MSNDFIVGQTHSFSIGLRDASNEWIAKVNPTLDTANDFAISINGAAWDTLDNAPTVSPAGSEFVDVTFSIAETTAAGVGGYIKLRVADADAASGWIGGVERFKGVIAAPATTADVTTITNALTTIDDFLDTEIAAILAKVNALPVDPADASDIAASFTTLTNKLTKYVQLLARKDAAIATDNATELTAINANGGSGGGAFANTTDSAEALRDRGDSAWITATGFATPTNITAGTITTVTNLTNAPTVGDLTATMKASITTAATAATPTVAAVTGNVGGNVVGSVGSVVAGVGLATDAVNAAAVAASAVTEIQSGLATAAALATVDTVVDGIKAVTDALPNGGALTTITNNVTAILADTGTDGVVIAANAVNASALANDALAEIVAAILGEVLESGKTVKQAILDMWAVQVGDALANSATEPTSIAYDSPDGSVQVTHALTSTTRAVS